MSDSDEDCLEAGEEAPPLRTTDSDTDDDEIGEDDVAGQCEAVGHTGCSRNAPSPDS